jgi:hypothetical protein
MLVKILGVVDFFVAFIFLLLLFGAKIPFPFILFIAAIMIVKGIFIIWGDFLSLIDWACALILILSIFLALPSAFLWVPLLILILKGSMSFF